MINITEDRLRWLVREQKHLTLDGAVEIAKAAPDLLAEIERLRADREAYTSWAAEIKIGVDAMRADNEKLRTALKFYRDPFAWKKLHDPDNDIQVPDFYSETSFGDTAEVALGDQQTEPHPSQSSDRQG